MTSMDVRCPAADSGNPITLTKQTVDIRPNVKISDQLMHVWLHFQFLSIQQPKAGKFVLINLIAGVWHFAVNFRSAHRRVLRWRKIRYSLSFLSLLNQFDLTKS